MKSRAREQIFMFPLVHLAAAFAIGVWIGQVNLPLAGLLVVGSVCLALLVFALLKLRREITVALITLSFLLAGAVLATLERSSGCTDSVKQLMKAGSIQSGDPIEVTGVLDREPETARDRKYLTLRVASIGSGAREQKASGLISLVVPVSTENIAQIEQLELTYGARLRIMTTLNREDQFRNPGVSSFTEYLDRKGYDATGFIKSPRLIERLENERVFVPLALLYQWRTRLQAGIDSNFSNQTAGVLDAALLGNRYNLSRETAERFRDGGTFHVLVISGLHITFLGGVVFFLIKRFTRKSYLQFLASAVVVWSYSVAVGAEASVVRAALMFTIVLLAPLVSRRASSLNALGSVAICLLVWRPSDLLDPSFQLTFVSVLAIVVIAWPLLEKLKSVGSWRPTRETPYPPTCNGWLRSFAEALFWSERRAANELELSSHSYRLFKSPMAGILERMRIQWLLRYVFAAVVVSASVQLMLLPFLVVYFHRLSLSSLFLNIVVGLLLAGVAGTAIAGLLIAQISGFLAAPLFKMAEALSWLMVHSGDPFNSIGIESLRLPHYSGWAGGVYGLYYLPLTLLIVLLFRWQPLQLPTARHRNLRELLFPAFIAQTLAVALVVFHPFSETHEARVRVDFLDVGQGDAALITLPDGTTILVDAGGQPGPFKRTVSSEDGEELSRDTRSIGEAVVSEYLWWRGLDHVDYLVATHADADHIDGFNAVAKNFKVSAALVARTPSKDLEYEKFIETLSAEEIPIRLIGAGDELHVAGVVIKILLPSPAAGSDLKSANNDSLVLQLKYGDRSFLMTADIEARAEKSLLRYSSELISDVVKVAHHGSKTSSSEDFVTATGARFAVISVGRRSMFGHPNPEVVERWQQGGAEVLTTGNRGTITFATDGTTMQMTSFVQAGE